jgi:hypothetical protein
VGRRSQLSGRGLNGGPHMLPNRSLLAATDERQPAHPRQVTVYRHGAQRCCVQCVRSGSCECRDICEPTVPTGSGFRRRALYVSSPHLRGLRALYALGCRIASDYCFVFGWMGSLGERSSGSWVRSKSSVRELPHRVCGLPVLCYGLHIWYRIFGFRFTGFLFGFWFLRFRFWMIYS